MAGDTDLTSMLATIAVERRPGLFCFVTGHDELAATAEATVREEEGISAIVSIEVARRRGIEPDFIASWLTLRVHSALEAVGLTAAFSAALTDEGISCNVIAGYHHDHLLVPADRVDDAIAAIESLRSSQLDPNTARASATMSCTTSAAEGISES